ncbi:energy transducer TonB [Luteimonas yindakuii]|uniref:Energy transducer TonB n=1 Tax=Luteimonas yindakuii TaxID=2565782 RepID=A0A4Z1RIE4_9GAMM|nr:energy transducer TonB [Luteimonas yindakuii]TKS53899.1 energy transducer TonB [Luteimonas yindakuii]
MPARIAIAMGIAFAVGLLLFALVYFDDRGPALPGNNAGPVAPMQSHASGALPAPQPPGEDRDVPGLYGPAPADPGLAGTAQPPAAAVTPVPEPPRAAVDAPPPPATTAATASRPVAVRRQQPAYPRTSLRRGESGEVLVRAVVGIDGRPRQVDVARSSGHPALDRAAVRAVERWRFEPARQAGQPVEGEVRVPVEFVSGQR